MDEPETQTANPFDPEQMKLLAMMLVENRGDMNFAAGLTPYGQRIFSTLQGTLAKEVLGVEVDLEIKEEPVHCAACGAPVFTEAQRRQLGRTSLTGGFSK